MLQILVAYASVIYYSISNDTVQHFPTLLSHYLVTFLQLITENGTEVEYVHAGVTC